MENLYLDKEVAGNLAKEFGQTSSEYEIESKVTTSSSLPNAKQFVALMELFGKVINAYSSMIQQDEKKIQDFISGVVAADTDT